MRAASQQENNLEHIVEKRFYVFWSKHPIVALQDYYAPEDFMIGLTVEILR